MSDRGPLQDVAEALGIEHGYHDIWGHWHALSQATARALVQAMDIGTDDEHALRSTCESLHARSWRRLAPPVVVLRRGQSAQVPLAVGAGLDRAVLRWQLRCEDGDLREGESAVTSLAVVEEKTVEDLNIRRRTLPLPADLPLGYHVLNLELAGNDAQLTLINAPARCHAEDARHWGFSTALYALRSARNWGIGDFTDLCSTIAVLAPLGASFIGLNPLHALYPAAPEKASPYSPSSRLQINPLYLDVEAIEDFAESDTARATVMHASFQSQLATLRDAQLVDYVGVARSKFQILELLFQHFLETHMGTGSTRAEAFDAFRHAGARPLYHHALFEALTEHLGTAGDPLPPGYLEPDAPAVSAFEREHGQRIQFFQYLQWQCVLQLSGCRAAARAHGMSLGLYLDLAVGSDARGSDVWAFAGDHARGVSIGAPPDDFAPQGQVWGLPPWRPDVLRDKAYAPFIHCLRASMRHAGALRIDHVLGLLRLFWVAEGGTATEGAYIHYPMGDLLAVVALESVREHCLVVGEDLGTVPDTMRAALAEFGMLSYRVFYFEKHWHGDHSFRAPQEYPREALTTASTHDLPTLAGFWTGRDLEIHHQLGLFPSPQFEATQRETREQDRWRILDALQREGLRPPHPERPGEGPPPPQLVEAIHAFLARTPSTLLSIQLEDVLGVGEQANVPGTITEQPNWRRKLPLAVEEFARHPGLTGVARTVEATRPGNH